jgi:two-component system response regulator
MRRRPATILYADDDPDDRMLTADAMRHSRLAHRLEAVEDGSQLLAYLRRQGQWADPDRSPRPGLILLDLNMPGIDGRQALTAIKADPQLAAIPVVVLTTSQAASDIAACYEVGASSYIAKPVTFSGLVQVMADLGHYWFEVVLLPAEAA